MWYATFSTTSSLNESSTHGGSSCVLEVKNSDVVSGLFFFFFFDHCAWKPPEAFQRRIRRGPSPAATATDQNQQSDIDTLFTQKRLWGEVRRVWRALLPSSTSLFTTLFVSVLCHFPISEGLLRLLLLCNNFHACSWSFRNVSNIQTE